MIKKKYPANTPNGINNRDSVTPCPGGPAPSSLALLGSSGQGPGTGMPMLSPKSIFFFYAKTLVLAYI